MEEELERHEGLTFHVSPLVLVASGVSCFLSIIGSTLIIFTYCKWREFRNRPREILMCLSVSDLILVITYLFGMLRYYKDSSVDCVIQSFISTIANLCTVLWTSALIVYLFIVIVLMDRNLADRILPACHAICWGLPVFLAIVFVSRGGLGYCGNVITVGWCWIDIKDTYFLLWMLLAGVIWDVMSYILLPVIFVLVHSNLNKQIKLSHELHNDQKHNILYFGEVDNKLLWLPLVFIFLRIWGTVRFFLYITGALELTDVSVQVLLALQGVGSTLQGAVNALLCCFLTKHVRQRLVPIMCCFIAPRNTAFGVNDGDVSDNVFESASDTDENIKLIPQKDDSQIY